MDDAIPFGGRWYFLMLALLVFSRGMDILSTWIATPNLVLEGNPIAKKLGWKWGLAPKIAWNPEHFFRFRKYWPYNGGVATDLLYHKLAPLLITVAGANGQYPLRVSANGGLYIEKDGRDQQSTGQHYVGTDEQSAVARRQPLLQTAISHASGTNKYPLPHTVLMRVGAVASSPSLRRSLETRPSMERSRPS